MRTYLFSVRMEQERSWLRRQFTCNQKEAIQAFVKIDLGTIHQQLFESELFGARKGAYTGLTSDKIGRISMADKGTLFLDELGNLEPPMQSKLLSTLQNREVIRVGDVRPEKGGH